MLLANRLSKINYTKKYPAQSQNSTDNSKGCGKCHLTSLQALTISIINKEVPSKAVPTKIMPVSSKPVIVNPYSFLTFLKIPHTQTTMKGSKEAKATIQRISSSRLNFLRLMPIYAKTPNCAVRKNINNVFNKSMMIFIFSKFIKSILPYFNKFANSTQRKYYV